MSLDIVGGSDADFSAGKLRTRIPSITDRGIAFDLKGTEITYKVLSSPSPNPQTGAISQTSTDTVISRALIGWATDQDVAESKGRYKTNDRVFRVRAVDLPARPNRGARVVFDGKTYNVVGYRTDQTDSVYDLFCREP